MFGLAGIQMEKEDRACSRRFSLPGTYKPKICKLSSLKCLALPLSQTETGKSLHNYSLSRLVFFFTKRTEARKKKKSHSHFKNFV